MGSLNKVSRKIEKLYEKGLTEGIDFEDFKKVRGLDEDLKTCPAETISEMNKKIESLKHLNSIVNQAKKSGLNSRFYGQNFNYIIKNGDLLLLALFELAMSKLGEAEIDIVKNNSVIMPCTLHGGSSNQFLVKDIDNRFECLGCSKTGTNIDFLSAKHRNLNTNEIIEAICHLYGFKVPYQTEKSVVLADRIRTIFANDLSEFYVYMLESLRDTLVTDKKIPTWDGYDVISIYDKRIKSVDRIIAGETDPNFTYNVPPKKIVLLPQEK